jgi:hypothetical protein
MQFALLGAVGLAAVLAVEAGMTPNHAATVPLAGRDPGLVTRIAGKWKGERTTSISARPLDFTMYWHAAPDGKVTGSVKPKGEHAYPVKVVWSSDTAFIYESAPHMSHLLHERVVTRGEAYFKGHELQGSFEARPTRYEGKTITGKFSASRLS